MKRGISDTSPAPPTRAQPGFVKLAAELDNMSAAADAVAPAGDAAPPTDAAVDGITPAEPSVSEGEAPAASAAEADAEPAPPSKPKYPLKVQYCRPCGLPGELCGYVSKTQFEKCKPWLRVHAPHHFPDLFPDECAARLEALKLSAETGEDLVPDDDEEDTDEVKVAVPIEQKTSGGKKKKAAAEIVLMLGQRKGKKQVTIVYGLDLFGIKLKDAAKAAKRKFATGSSVTVVSFVHVFDRQRRTHTRFS